MPLKTKKDLKSHLSLSDLHRSMIQHDTFLFRTYSGSVSSISLIKRFENTAQSYSMPWTFANYYWKNSEPTAQNNKQIHLKFSKPSV